MSDGGGRRQVRSYNNGHNFDSSTTCYDTDIGMSFFSANDFLFNNDLSIHSGQILWAMGGIQKGYRKGYRYRCVWPAGQGGVAKVGLTMREADCPTAILPQTSWFCLGKTYNGKRQCKSVSTSASRNPWQLLTDSCSGCRKGRFFFWKSVAASNLSFPNFSSRGATDPRQRDNCFPGIFPGLRRVGTPTTSVWVPTDHHHFGTSSLSAALSPQTCVFFCKFGKRPAFRAPGPRENYQIADLDFSPSPAALGPRMGRTEWCDHRCLG